MLGASQAQRTFKKQGGVDPDSPKKLAKMSAGWKAIRSAAGGEKRGAAGEGEASSGGAEAARPPAAAQAQEQQHAGEGGAGTEQASHPPVQSGHVSSLPPY